MVEFIFYAYLICLAFGIMATVYAICGVFYYKVIKGSKKSINQILSEL